MLLIPLAGDYTVLLPGEPKELNDKSMPRLSGCGIAASGIDPDLQEPASGDDSDAGPPPLQRGVERLVERIHGRPAGVGPQP